MPQCCTFAPENRCRISPALTLISVEAFDWNCSQHITPRFATDDIAAAIAPLRDKIRELEEEFRAR